MHAFPDPEIQWLSAGEPVDLCIALAAYSCRDSRGFGRGKPARTAFPLRPSREGTGAMVGAGRTPIPAPLWTANRMKAMAARVFRR